MNHTSTSLARRARTAAAVFLACIAGGLPPVQAAFDPVNDDTDIFLANPEVDRQRPNVLIYVDNTANWNSAFDNEKSALVSVIQNLTDAYNVGLMTFPETGTGNDSIDGGYIRFGVRRMTNANKAVLANNIIGNFDVGDDKGNNATIALGMAETYRYFGGLTSRASHGKNKTDYAGNNEYTPCSTCVGTAHPAAALSEHALDASTVTGVNPETGESGSKGLPYNSPISDGCQNNFVIYISNGPANENAAALAKAENLLESTGYDTSSTIPLTPNGNEGNWADEWAKVMAETDVNPDIDGDQHVYTYTVEVDPTTGGTQGPAMTALMKSVALNGKGDYFAVSSGNSGTAIINALNSIFQEIQAVNSVFASTTLPVSVNVRGTNLNQVYIGVFRPDEVKSPRWFGNLKMYQLGFDDATNTLFLADALGNKAENPETGFIDPSSPSFWTVNDSMNFWDFRTSEVNGVGGDDDFVDGDLVEKGGAAQQQRQAFSTEAAQDARKLYTCAGIACVSGVNLTDPDFSLDTLNTGVTEAAFELGEQAVSTLTGFDSKSITHLDDSKSVTSLSTATGNIPITDLNNGGATVSVSGITSSVTRTLTGLSNTGTAVVIQSQTHPSGGGFTNAQKNVVTVTVASAHGLATGDTVTIAATVHADYNGTYQITKVDDFKFTYDTNGTSTEVRTRASPAATPGTYTVNSTIVTATTSVDHGFVSGRTVTIAGVTPTAFNDTYTITSVPTSTTFRFQTASSLATPSVLGTATSIIDTATATTTTNHGYAVNDVVTVANSSIAGYNGNVTVTAVPTTTKFSYAVTGPLNAASNAGMTSTKGSTTVTATAPGHGFTNGQTVTILGASPDGYNGSYVINTVVAGTSFKYTTSTAQTANTGTSVTASGGTSTTARAQVTGHNFGTAGSSVPLIIEGVSNLPAAYNGSVTALIIDANTFSYPTEDGSSPAPATGTITVRPSTATAYATLADHGFRSVLAASLCPVVAVCDSAGSFSNGDFLYGVSSGASGRIVSSGAGSFTLTEVTGDFLAAETLRARTTAADDADVDGYPDANVAVASGAQTASAGSTFTITVSGATPTDYNRPDATATVVDSDTFSYPLATITNLAQATGTILAKQKTKTATARAVAHGFSTGDAVTINGASPTAFTGTYYATVLGDDTFTYDLTRDGPILAADAPNAASAQGDATGTIIAASGSPGGSALQDIVDWIRGADNFQDEDAGGDVDDVVRASIHGDVLHSRPAVVNYNRYGSIAEPDNNDVYIFYGANDGLFRAVRGGFDLSDEQAADGAPEPGNEAWAFLPEEFFDSMQRMRDNEPTISSFNKKPYFADGSLGVYSRDGNGDLALDVTTDDDSDPDKVHLFISMRRGGRFIYAMDVSDPLLPKLLWRHSSDDPGWEEFGYSWSVPRVITTSANGGDPMLIFGAGYDPAVEDLDPATITTFTAEKVIQSGGQETFRTMGRGIFVVDALTGDLLWQAVPSTVVPTSIGQHIETVPGMDFAIQSDVTVLRDRAGSVTNRAYVGDAGGNIWRIDMEDSDVANWQVTQLASVANHLIIPGGLRKFQFPPDVVYSDDGYDAVLIGTGDREHPFDESVDNRMYMFKDTGIEADDPVFGNTEDTLEESDLYNATANCIQDEDACDGGPEGNDPGDAIAKLAAADGWFIELGVGEKVVGSVVTLNRVTFFNTNQPSTAADVADASCASDLGIARQYKVLFDTGESSLDVNLDGVIDSLDRAEVHPGGGYLPSPVPVVVEIDGQTHEGVISGVAVDEPPGSLLNARLRKFWYKEIE